MKVLYQKLRQINNMKHKDRVTLCGVARSFLAYRTKSVCENPYNTSKYLVL